ncbi:MAG: murein biosynthesis integral membrane protein MurJ [Proteobacteria bacterium]|nr:murein biosynthesis integral membrane protein MurJ [Pseudomonadota bacterium]
MPTSETIDSKNIRSAGLIGVITVISRILGLIREIVVAIFLGTSVLSDAFTLAFAFPDLFRRLFAEGALANSFTPKFISITKTEGPDAAGQFAGSMALITGITTGSICLIAIIFAPAFVEISIGYGLIGSALDSTILLTRIMVAYIVLISVTGIYQGILNSVSVFWVSSLTPVLLNLSIISCALILSPHLSNPAVGFALGVIAGGLAQFLFHLPFVFKIELKIKYKIDWSNPHLKSTIRLMIPTIFGIGVYQINILISNIIASTLETGSVASLKFSNRLLELIIGVFVISLATVILPRLSNLFVDKKLDEIRNNLALALSITWFWALPLTVGGILLAEEIVTLIYARGEFDSLSIRLTSEAFVFHLLGLCFIAGNRIFLSSFQALGLVRSMVFSGIIALVANLCLAIILKGVIGHQGVALATSISQLLHMLALVFFLRNQFLNRIWSLLTTKTNLASIFATVVMLLLLYPIKNYLAGIDVSYYVNLIILIPIGVVVYFVISYLLKNQAMILMHKSLLRKSVG